ncbi:MAG: subclass B3 metallo-beta-lactamase [Gemmatimonadota bacterium]
MTLSRHTPGAIRLLAACTLAAEALSVTALAAQVTPHCGSCAVWNTPQSPFRVYGNTYYVGTHGLGAVLITSPQGHILIDGGLAESAPLIAASIRALGFKLEDLRAIVNSHVHYDHAGGMAALQRESGADVFASARSIRVLQGGAVGLDDPQHKSAFPISPVKRVRAIPAGDTVRVGDLALRALPTPGHTPGGTSWTWISCEDGRCLSLVYGDSQTPVSDDDFYFSRSTTYPTALADFASGFSILEQVTCDILLTPHPDASGMWERVARHSAGDADAMRDPSACRRYAASARERLAKRVDTERASAPRSR